MSNILTIDHYDFYGTTLDANDLGELQRYVEKRIPPGSYLRAVLSNNLRGACEKMDPGDGNKLHALVACIYNACPANCWGSPEHVKEWLADVDSVRTEEQA